MRSALPFLLAAALAVPAARAQTTTATALPFLEIAPSPSLNGLGGAGVALPSSDPYAFLTNPAHLGLAARDVPQATALYPGGAADWLAVGDLAFGSMAATTGANVTLGGVPLSVGAGLAQATLSHSERLVPGSDGATYEQADRYRALSLGAATAGPVRFALGTTARYVTSTDRATMRDGAPFVSHVRGITLDLGVLASADVARLARLRPVGGLWPALDVTVGYAQVNMGGTVGYSVGGPAPLPRTARLGWSATGGLDRALGRAGALRLFEATVSVQAEHGLVRQDADGNVGYAALVGGLDPLANGLLGAGDDDVTGRRGVRVALGETVAFSRGAFDGWGFSDVRAHGVELRLAGPLKLAAALTRSERLADVARRVDLRYARSVTFAGGRDESRFSGLSLIVRR